MSKFVGNLSYGAARPSILAQRPVLKPQPKEQKCACCGTTWYNWLSDGVCNICIRDAMDDPNGDFAVKVWKAKNRISQRAGE